MLEDILCKSVGHCIYRELLKYNLGSIVPNNTGGNDAPLIGAFE